jgi:hypothetical protein
MPYTEAQKRASKRWVEKNQERIKEYRKVYFCYRDTDFRKEFYEKNKEVIKKRALDRYYYKKECERIRCILL